MKLHFKAGDFEIETWTESHPMWMNLSLYGTVICQIEHDKLSDLQHVIARMKSQARAHMPENYRHEFD